MIDRGCELHGNKTLKNTVKCRDSYLQKYPDKPWTVFLPSKGLQNLKEIVLKNTPVEVSGIGMGITSIGAAWSKVDVFKVGRILEINIFDEDLDSSNLEGSLKNSLDRIDRISSNAFSDNIIVDVDKTITKELNNISYQLELAFEKAYSDSIGDSVCTSTPDIKRVWTPQNNDQLKFKITMNCILPNSTSEEVKFLVDTLGERGTIKTVHRSGINSVLTPDGSMYVRKVVLHDKNLGGPFFALGVRNRNDVKSDKFLHRLELLEKRLS